MIELKINEGSYTICTSWNEVTMKHYCDIVTAQEKPFAERIAAYSLIPIDIINQMKIAQLHVLSELVEFMEGFDSVNAFSIGYESEITIGEQPYWKVEKCKQLLKDNPYPITVAAEIVALYTGDKDGENGIQISDKPVTEVIGMCAFFLQHCQNSLRNING